MNLNEDIIDLYKDATETDLELGEWICSECARNVALEQVSVDELIYEN